MKIAVIGGGSTYTPELIEGFARRGDVLSADELVLHDIAADRLAVVGGLASRILAAQGFGGRLVITTSLDEAVDAAAAVLVQLRVGGQQARLVDETLPGRFGLLGQETTGPGGFAKALRTVPVVLNIAKSLRNEHRATPGSSTSPTRWASSPGRCSTRLPRVGPLPSRSGSSVGSPPASAWRPTRSAGPRRTEPPVVDPPSARRRRRSVADLLDTPAAEELAERSVPRPITARWARSLPTTCATSTAPTGQSPSRRAARAGRRSPADRANAPRDVRRPGARPQAGAARTARRRVLQRGGGGVVTSLLTRRCTPLRRRAQQQVGGRTAGRRGGRGSGDGRPGRRAPVPIAPLAPELLGLSGRHRV